MFSNQIINKANCDEIFTIFNECTATVSVAQKKHQSKIKLFIEKFI